MLGIDLRGLLVYDACCHWHKQFTASSSSPHSHIRVLASTSVRKNIHCTAADIVARGCRILLTELATRGLQHICTLKIRCNASFHALSFFFSQMNQRKRFTRTSIPQRVVHQATPLSQRHQYRALYTSFLQYIGVCITPITMRKWSAQLTNPCPGNYLHGVQKRLETNLVMKCKRRRRKHVEESTRQCRLSFFTLAQHS